MIRLIDIIISIILLLILSPFFIFLIFLKFIFDGFPIFYNSKRCVMDMKLVNIYKFRTMINDRKIIEAEVVRYRKDGFESIPLSSKIYTKIGRVYEKYQLVELPQLLNVIKGDLSLVGYRPLPHKNISLLIDAYGEDIVISRHKYRAGLSGYSQILGKDKFTPEERIKIELLLSRNLYEKNKLKSLKVYLTILLDTFFLVIFDKTFFINSKN